jgi:hypothetical protein
MLRLIKSPESHHGSTGSVIESGAAASVVAIDFLLPREWFEK